MKKIIPFYGDGEDKLTIPRTPEFFEAAKVLGDYIGGLPLTVEQNDRLVELAVQQVNAAERSAFNAGVGLGARIGRDIL